MKNSYSLAFCKYIKSTQIFFKWVIDNLHENQDFEIIRTFAQLDGDWNEKLNPVVVFEVSKIYLAGLVCQNFLGEIYFIETRISGWFLIVQ